MGDINIDMNRWKDEEWELKYMADAWRNTISNNGLLYEDLGITYAHPNGVTRSALDHVYFNNKSIAQNCRKINNSLSDHFPIMVDLEMNKVASHKKDRYILRRCFKKFIKDDFIQDLLSQIWDSPILADPSVSASEKAAYYDNLFESCLNRHAPIKKFKIHQKYRKGLSQETLNLIKERNKARLESIRATDTNKHVLAIKYRKLRNKVIAKIRKESKEAVIEDIRRNNSPSEYWKSVKSITLSQDDEEIELREDGKLITADQEIANIMCPFFKDKIEGIEREIPHIDISPTSKLEESLKDSKMKFSLRPVTETQVEKAIKSLKSTSEKHPLKKPLRKVTRI